MIQTDIVLTILPFAPLWYPSMGISALTGAAKEKNLSIKTIYPIFRLSNKIGIKNYIYISENNNDISSLLIEYLYSCTLFKKAKKKYNYFFNTIEQLTKNTYIYPKIKNMRSLDYLILEQHLDEEVDRILSFRPKIVGCSSIFSQHLASLSLLKKIKQKNKKIITMIGGANCEKEMGFEVSRQFPWIDFVFSGESDFLFPNICEQLLKSGIKKTINNLPYGVYHRKKVKSLVKNDSKKKQAESCYIDDLDRLPYPDFQDFFEEFEQYENFKNFSLKSIYLESSRGCWKGQKQPCSFCSLNSTHIGYRTKSGDRFQHEIETLSKKYQTPYFFLADNIISKKSFNSWIKQLAKEKKQSFFCETSSLLQEKEVQLLNQAGVFQIQLGIESLNDHLLELINKGNSAIHNISLLKILKENCIEPCWNMLMGIPGEKIEDYQSILEIIPLIHHLSPPTGGGCNIVFSKFSDYYYHPEKYQISLEPYYELYRMIYPGISDRELENLIFYYQNKNQQDFNLTQVKQNMVNDIKTWYNLHFKNKKKFYPRLEMTVDKGKVYIQDKRQCAIQPEFWLTSMESEIYQIIQTPKTMEQIQKISSLNKQIQDTRNTTELLLRDLVNLKLVIRVNDKYLALANRKPDRNSVSEIKLGAYQGLKEMSQLLQ